MNSILNVTALEIDAWSSQANSKHLFPDLVRRLIFATAPRLLQIDFPAGDSTYEGGWDGIVLDILGSAFIPEGISGWELGTVKDKGKKAREDYDERSSNPRTLDPAETTFVLVTSRNWGADDKRNWADDKKSEGKWKDVRLYDAKDIELWLNDAPAVQYWFSKLINKRPKGAIDLESYWLDWEAQTNPIIPSVLLTAGRKKVTDEANSWLKGSTPSLAIRADSRPEAIAVFAATILLLQPDEQLTYFTHCVVVKNEEAWPDLTSITTPLILIPLFENRSQAVASAIRQGHRVFLPLDRADNNWRGSATEVPRLPRLEVEVVLRNIGLSDEKAARLAGVARRSFAAFRRELTASGAIEQPKWVDTDQKATLITALLVGAWDEQKEQDKEVVARLTGISYLVVKNQLVNWTKQVDPPVRLVGTTWYIIDKGDVWNLIHEFVTQEQLDSFRQVVLDVLASIPPRFEISQDEWYRADMMGYESPYSDTLRESLATTLTYMGVFEEPLPAAQTSTKRVAEWVVDQLLRRANADWRIWSAISSYLRWFAEAAPNTFLAGVEEGLKGEEPVILNLFNERSNPLGPSSDYPGLLWALEVLAWNEKYLARSVFILAQLERLTPKLAFVNSPLNSLREIFVLWHPQTAAPLSHKLEVLDQLQQQEPEVAAALLERISPKAHSVSTGTTKPRWRDWVPTTEVTRREVYEATLAIQERLLNNAGQDVERWEAIIKGFPQQPYDQQTLIIAKLGELSQTLATNTDRIRLRDVMREIISRHCSFRDADWAMHPEQVVRLEEIMNKFEPTDIIGKHAWLFDDWPKLSEGGEQNSETYQLRIDENQQEALEFIYRSGGLDSVLTFIPHVKNSFVLGRALIRYGISEEVALQLVTTYLTAEDDSQAKFGLGVAAALITIEGDGWGIMTLETQPTWSLLQKAQWLLLLPQNPRTWKKVAELDDVGQDYYWGRINPFRIEDEDIEEVARLLMQHKQVAKAVELLGNHVLRGHAVSTELALLALERLFFEPTEEHPSSYTIEELLEKLAATPDIDRTRVIRLEFHFLPASYYYRKGKNKKLIFQELAVNPNLFAELIAAVFRVEGAEPRVLTDEEAYPSMASYSVLESWREVPGLDKDGKVEKDILFSWVAQARKATEESGHKVIGEQQIGQLLSGSPKGTDRMWPHEAVRDLLEHEKSTEIEKGFIIGHYNSRGTTTRSPYEGGRQERRLEKEYLSYAAAIEPKWPRTGNVLNLIAEDYARQAKREDDDASIQEDLES